ncbi:MAG TPA: MFS transporter [Actinomycetota bacterium]|nr:MFS transporter [Actinomycetota bacterium]
MLEQARALRTTLGNRDLRYLLSGQFLAQAADGLVQGAAANVLLLEPLSAGTPARMFELFVLTLVPYSVIAPFLGVFVDRWARRATLVGTNVVRGVLLCSFPLWDGAFGGNTAIYASVLLVLGFGRLFLVTKGAALPVVAHERELLTANAVSGGGGMISALGGGMIGLGISGAFGLGTAFLAAGVAYVLAAWLAARIADPLRHGRSEAIGAAVARVAAELWSGAREIWAHPAARLPLAGIFIVRTAGMVTAIIAILVIQKEFPETGDLFGARQASGALALASAGAGAFLGAILAPALGRWWRKPGLIMLGFAVSGSGITVLGGVVSIAAVLGLTFVGGFGTFLAKIATDAQLQEVLPDDFRGRGFALYDILYNLASVAAAGLILMFEDVSFRLLVVCVGAITLGLAALLGAAMKRAGMTFRTSPEMQPARS